MTFEARMAALFADSRITALVGARTYPVQAGQRPSGNYILWQRISSTPAVTHDDIAGLTAYGIQVTCIAGTFAEACAIRETVKEVIEPESVDHSNETSLFSDDINQFAESIDFTIYHDKAA